MDALSDVLRAAKLNGAVFLHPVVLAILPGALMRVAGIAAIGAGVSAAALGGLVYAETEGTLLLAASRPADVGGR